MEKTSKTVSARFPRRLTLTVILALFFSLTSGTVLAKKSKESIRKCMYYAQLQYFKAVDRALTRLVQRKKGCRPITTVDNYLRCIESAKNAYNRDIQTAKQRYFRARLRCYGWRRWKGKDRVLIPRKKLYKQLKLIKPVRLKQR